MITSGFEWQKIVEDWDDWSKWINSRGGIGVRANESWESWWEEEQEHLQHTGFSGLFWEIVLSVRFFIYQYGIVYHLNVSKHSKLGQERSILVSTEYSFVCLISSEIMLPYEKALISF